GMLWFYSARWMSAAIDEAYREAPAKGYEFLGEKPVVAGFPLLPEIVYRGGFKTGNLMITFPEARLRGFPVPGLTVTLSLPQGIHLEGVADPDIWSLDTLAADIAVPYRIPGDYEYETLAQWQRRDGKIEVRHYRLTKD